MPSLDPKVHKCLKEEWLPRLIDLGSRRRPMQRLMIGILLIPLILSVVIIVHVIFISKDYKWVEGVVVTFLLGLSSVCFVYIGKIQACNDELLAIEYAVIVGDQALLIDMISKLGCFGSFREILNDARRLAVQHE